MANHNENGPQIPIFKIEQSKNNMHEICVLDVYYF